MTGHPKVLCDCAHYEIRTAWTLIYERAIEITSRADGVCVLVDVVVESQRAVLLLVRLVPVVDHE
jgi:hypothetical protein